MRGTDEMIRQLERLRAALEALRPLSDKAGAGPWEVDTEPNEDGEYGSGPDPSTGYDDFMILAAEGGKILGTENATHKSIMEDGPDEYGHVCAWDHLGKGNADFLVACVNFVLEALATPQASAGEQPAPDALIADLADRIKSVVEFQGYGHWRTCSGCYESEDGYPNGHYPRSDVLGCTLGAGCSECGGIGAVWDNIDYGAMADEMHAEDRRATDRETPGQAAWRFTQSVADSDSVMCTYAAPEFDDLNDDGKQWIRAIVRETVERSAQAAETFDTFGFPGIPTERSAAVQSGIATAIRALVADERDGR